MLVKVLLDERKHAVFTAIMSEIQILFPNKKRGRQCQARAEAYLRGVMANVNIIKKLKRL